MSTSSDPAQRAPDSEENSDPAPPKTVSKLGLLRSLGPGLVTGASDDDPSGIATYSQVGAQYGFGMLWLMLFSYPLMAGIQEISAEIGRVTGHGIAGNLRRYYPRWILYCVVLLLFVANTINLGADVEAMGASASLLTGAPSVPFAITFGLLSFTLAALMPYDRYAGVLKWLCASLFAYVATVFVVHVPWADALKHTVVPHLELNAGFITGMVAVLGTTISPYLFFWQAEEEVEIEKADPVEEPLIDRPDQAPSQLQRIRIDTYTGMAFSNIVAFFIILTAAATLHVHGVTNIQTAGQAALALEPVAGRFAFFMFALGIVGTGLLAVPVLGGSAAYAVGEALNWPVGLARQPLQAKGFYAVLALATGIGVLMSTFHVDPIKALFWSAVINGVAAAPIMILMMLMACNPNVMRSFCLNPRQKLLGWAATVVMIASAIGLFATLSHP